MCICVERLRGMETRERDEGCGESTMKWKAAREVQIERDRAVEMERG